MYHVKKARKDNPVAKAGKPYYWWKFRYGGKRYSSTYPKPSQLSQSEYLSRLFELQEQREEIDKEDQENAASECREVAEYIRELGQEQDEKRMNMPYALQDGDTGCLLEERCNACEEMADSAECIADEIENLDYEESDDSMDLEDWLTDRITEQLSGMNWEI